MAIQSLLERLATTITAAVLSIQVYQWDEATSTWNAQGADIEGKATNDWSGYSLALSDDATTLAIGANQVGNQPNPGYVRIYQWDGSAWQQQGLDINGETVGDWSGHDVALSADGSIVAISAPKNAGGGTNSGHVRIYQWLNGQWTKLGDDIDGEALGDESGTSVALSADGLTLAVGASSNDGNGTNAGHTGSTPGIAILLSGSNNTQILMDRLLKTEVAVPCHCQPTGQD